mgnify:CR=1 FL=1
MKKGYISIALAVSLAGLFSGCALSTMAMTEKQENTKQIGLTKIASYETSLKGGSEIVAFDKDTSRMFTTNGALNKIDISEILFNKQNLKTSIVKVDSIDLSIYGTGVNSVAVSNGKVAVAVEVTSTLDNSKQLRGSVVIFDTQANHIKTIKTGYLPDMVTFNEDGSKVIVANEGEPNKNYTYDPKGSIGIIDIKNNYEYTDINFFDIEVSSDVIIKKGSSAGVDLEPEYISVSGNKAYISLQENNAMAVVNLDTKELESVSALGFKDHSKQYNSLDIEEEGKILLKPYSNLFGMYQPDSIATYKVKGKTYVVTANEGDGREYGKYENESKISKIKLSPKLVEVYKNENDLKINNELGKNGDVYEKLYTFGTRSFSIWNDKSELVFDSKNELAIMASKYEPALFNQDKGKIDKRSGNKGVEPEALALGEVNGRMYAFVGLERQSSIVIYDITNPKKASFVNYINTKNSDLSPEGMKFVEAKDSPTHKALLLVAFEISGSTSVFEVN